MINGRKRIDPCFGTSIHSHSCKDGPEGERRGSPAEGAGRNDEGLSEGGDSGGTGEGGGARKRKVSSRSHIHVLTGTVNRDNLTGAEPEEVGLGFGIKDKNILTVKNMKRDMLVRVDQGSEHSGRRGRSEQWGSSQWGHLSDFALGLHLLCNLSQLTNLSVP